jgi:hypothetical protein
MTDYSNVVKRGRDLSSAIVRAIIYDDDLELVDTDLAERGPGRANSLDNVGDAVLLVQRGDDNRQRDGRAGTDSFSRRGLRRESADLNYHRYDILQPLSVPGSHILQPVRTSSSDLVVTLQDLAARSFAATPAELLRTAWRLFLEMATQLWAAQRAAGEPTAPLHSRLASNDRGW